jgi:hypothetical protein
MISRVDPPTVPARSAWENLENHCAVTVTYDRDDAQRRIIIKLAGAFELPATLALVDRLAADGAWSYGLLYDARTLTSAPTMSELQTIVDRVQVMTARRPRGPVAVVTPDPSVSELAQMYASRLAGTVNIAVFRTLDEGRAWLDEVERM